MFLRRRQVAQCVLKVAFARRSYIFGKARPQDQQTLQLVVEGPGIYFAKEEHLNQGEKEKDDVVQWTR